MKIGIDMMGGDFAPAEVLKGIHLYLSGHTIPATLVMIGDQPSIEKLLPGNLIRADQVQLVHAPEVIGMHEHPSKAFREKKQSSISIGYQLLEKGEIDAFISAGNTGAMLAGALFNIKPLENLIRPAISSMIPKSDGTTGLLLDVGLNADCKPEQLDQFAIMGSVYAQLVLGIEDPSIGLINVGEEEEKGNLLSKAAFSLLKKNKNIRFTGNIEGRDVLHNKADVMVCDGFTGNILLKMAESLYTIARDKKLNSGFFERFNFEHYGGTPVLGIAKPVIIGHGISHGMAFMNMIHLAQVMVEKDVMNKMKERLK
ncbi:MAG TPA: phosphate acyltransferase PlsX [Chitinophagaceae bacterium]|nr:phosphate acyltransferase PlsX [Chitinophagaceae bacterium]